MTHPNIDIFVAHLKWFVKSVKGFDFDCLEDRSEEEAMEILEEHFGKEAMEKAEFAYAMRGPNLREGDPRTTDGREPSVAPRERDAKRDHQSVEGVGKVA